MKMSKLNLFKISVIVSSLVFCVFGLTIIIQENFFQKWQIYQEIYKNILISNSESENEKNIAQDLSLKINQINLNDFKSVDRCTSCHLGIENPKMVNENNPFKTHNDSLLQSHPIENYGCTVCHGGQGRALSLIEAHALEDKVNWGYPLLKLNHIQSNCGKCHLTLFKDIEPMNEMALIKEGLNIFKNEGCLGCHKARNIGGAIGPDLSDQGNKTIKEYNFDYIKGEYSIRQWLKEHFFDPPKISPGSKMFRYDFNNQEINALITLLLGFFEPNLPFKYYSIEMLEEFKSHRENINGVDVYGIICSSCHGKNGDGRS